MDLTGELRRHLRVIAHDIRVRRVGHEDKFALRERLKDLGEQEFADGERGADVAEVQGACVEGAAGVGGVDELHVVPCDLLGCRGEVVEVEIWKAGGPIGVDFGHVFPGCEGAREGVEEAFLGFVDFGYAEDVIDVADYCEAAVGDEVGGAVAQGCSFDVSAEALDLGGFVAVEETVALNLDKGVEVTLGGCEIRELNILVAAGCCNAAT